MFKRFLSILFPSAASTSSSTNDPTGEANRTPLHKNEFSGMTSRLEQETVLAAIEVVLDTNRQVLGTLRCIADDGSVMGGPWPVSGYADLRLAETLNNAERNPLLMGGHTPTGTYDVDDILPARVDEPGMSLFGRCEVIRLIPAGGDAALADANGRTSILICGGDERAPSDGSLRVSDEVMAALLQMVSGPFKKARRITVRVREEENTDGIWPVYTPSWYDTYGYDGSNLSDLYWQMYLWDEFTQPLQTQDGSCLDPYGAVVTGCLDTSDNTVGDASDNTVGTAEQNESALLAPVDVAVATAMVQEIFSTSGTSVQASETTSGHQQWQPLSDSAYG